MKDLILKLQKAHAGEISAYLAYDGHMRSISDPIIKERIQQIQNDELAHIIFLSKTLNELGSSPSSSRDEIHTYIGNTISALCFVTGFSLPMKVARMMETIGAAAYEDIGDEAYKQGLYTLAFTLYEMGEVERQHEEFFISQYQAI